VLLWGGVLGVLLHPGCIQYRECTQVHFSAAVYIYIYNSLVCVSLGRGHGPWPVAPPIGLRHDAKKLRKSPRCLFRRVLGKILEVIGVLNFLLELYI
jgi:hypothetical protein